MLGIAETFFLERKRSDLHRRCPQAQEAREDQVRLFVLDLSGVSPQSSGITSAVTELGLYFTTKFLTNKQ
jgi:hypothetical protein